MMYLVYQYLFCATLWCTILIWQHGLNLECICWTRFSKINILIQVVNELWTDKRHIKVPQKRLRCTTHVDNKKKQWGRFKSEQIRKSVFSWFNGFTTFYLYLFTFKITCCLWIVTLLNRYKHVHIFALISVLLHSARSFKQ